MVASKFSNKCFLLVWSALVYNILRLTKVLIEKSKKVEKYFSFLLIVAKLICPPQTSLSVRPPSDSWASRVLLYFFLSKLILNIPLSCYFQFSDLINIHLVFLITIDSALRFSLWSIAFLYSPVNNNTVNVFLLKLLNPIVSYRTYIWSHFHNFPVQILYYSFKIAFFNIFLVGIMKLPGIRHKIIQFIITYFDFAGYMLFMIIISRKNYSGISFTWKH